MILILGQMGNVYISYQITFGDTGEKPNGAVIPKKGFKAQSVGTIQQRSKRPVVCQSKITNQIILISQYWVYEYQSWYPNWQTPTLGWSPTWSAGLGGQDGIIFMDGQCRISPQILISEIYQMSMMYQILIIIVDKIKKPEQFQMLLSNIIGLIFLLSSYDWIVTITSWEQMNQSQYQQVTMQGSHPSGQTAIAVPNGRQSLMNPMQSIRPKGIIHPADNLSTSIGHESMEINSRLTSQTVRSQNDYGSSLSAGIKYFQQSAQTTTFMLIGVSQIYGNTGSTNYDILISQSGTYDTFGMLLITICLSMKQGAAPFHNWAPDLYDSLPTPITMYIAIIPKLTLLIFILLIIPMQSICSITFIHNSTFLSVLALISIFMGSIGLGSQWRIKRFITYSAIAHLGFILFASHIDSYLYYIFIYGITNIIFFMIILVRDDGQISSVMTGLFKQNPFIGIAISLTLFSQAGIPPLAGFFAKLQILEGLISSHQITIAILIIQASVISAANYLSLIQKANFSLPLYPYLISTPFLFSYILSFLITLLLTWFYLGDSILNLIIKTIMLSIGILYDESMPHA